MSCFAKTILLGVILLGILGPTPAALADEPGGGAQADCLADIPGELQPVWRTVCAGEARNRGLDLMRAGRAAFAAGHASLAERSFDTVLQGIEAVYAENEAAAAARSLWHSESVKDFKGEPYERVMAYYYRGLLYLMAGDWDNAQASFKGGVLQDSFAEEERFRSDVASLIWLEGWANQCRGNNDRAAQLFEEAKGFVAELAPPQAGETVLVIAETGSGPSKSAGGAHGEKLVIREGALGNSFVAAKLGKARQPLVEAENLFFQATTRGGRAADGILAEKAGTKTATATVGKTAMMAGAMTAAGNGGNGNQALIGLGIVVVGALMQASAEAMEPAADTRTWDNLPHSIHLRAMKPDAKPFDAGFDLLDPAGNSVIIDHKAVRRVTTSRCSLLWVGADNLGPESPFPVSASTGGGVAASGNCRTSTGGSAFLDADSCRRIGGAPASMPTGGGIATSGNCRTSTGGSAFMDADSCRRIGGLPL